jgi:hypothetical protein
MDDHKLGLEPTARANLRGWWGEDNCAMSVQGQKAKFRGDQRMSASASKAHISRFSFYEYTS